MTTYVISSNPVRPQPVRPQVADDERAARVGNRAQASRNRYVVSPRMLIALLVLATVSVLMTSVQADQPQAVVAYTVQPGDTLWSISAEMTPPGADVRETIAEVRGLNDLEVSIIHPGQVLQLPEG